MLWRLLASVLMVSDTGSIALTSEHMDWPTQQACEQAIQQFYTVRNSTLDLNGHRVQVRVTAQCTAIMRGEGPIGMVR
jgi:hypothetical protein